MPGAWVTPPTQSFSVVLNNTNGGSLTLIDGQAFGSPPYDNPATFTQAANVPFPFFSNDISVEPFAGVVDVQSGLWLISPTDLPLADYVPPYPVGAIGVEYDTADTFELFYPITLTPDPRSALSFVGTPDPTVHGLAKRLPYGAYIQSGTTPKQATVATWPSPSTVAPWLTAMTLDQSGVVTPATLALSVGDFDAGGSAVFWTGYDAFTDNYVPTAEVDGGIILNVTYTWKARRYRFIYSTLPPLRQFPRDDSLGGAPRQGRRNGPTSVQGSTRQGWRGTYR